jgi:hypothetical protein
MTILRMEAKDAATARLGICHAGIRCELTAVSRFPSSYEGMRGRPQYNGGWSG